MGSRVIVYCKLFVGGEVTEFRSDMTLYMNMPSDFYFFYAKEEQIRACYFIFNKIRNMQ